MPQDRYAHRNRQAHDTDNHQHGADPLQPHHPYQFRDYIGENGARSQDRRGVGEPLYLLAPHPPRAAQPYQQRGRCCEPEGVRDGFHRVHGVRCDLYAEGVVDEIESCGRLGPEHYGDRTGHDHHSNEPPEGSPIRRRRSAIRKQESHEHEETNVQNPKPGGEPGLNLPAWQHGRHRAGLRQQRHDGVLGGEEAHPRNHTDGAEEPAHRVPRREAGSDHDPHTRKADRDHGVLEPVVVDGPRSAGWTWAGRSPCTPDARRLQGAAERARRQPSSGSQSQKFFRLTSFRIWMSTACSATIFLRRVFSFSSSFRRLVASAFIPPYWFLQRWKVASLMPSSLAIWGTEAPAASSVSASRSMRTICSGVSLVQLRESSLCPSGAFGLS